MTEKKSAAAIALGVALSFGAASLTIVSVSAQAQKKEQQTVGPKVGNPLQAALTAAKNKQYDVALAKLKEAQAVPNKSAFEQYKINETLAFVYSTQRKYADLAGIYEKYLEDPQFLPAGLAETLPKQIAIFYYQAQQYPKSEEYSKQWLKSHPNDSEISALLGQTYYLTKDYKQCKETMGSTISRAEKSGAEPKEAWLQIAQACALSTDDDAGVMQAYEKLVRYYPKAEWWSQYLKRVMRAERSDTALFEWHRLMLDTGVMREPSDFMEYTQEAMINFESPVESLRVVEAGFSKQVLGSDPKNKIRHDTLLNKAKEAASAAKAKLAQLTSEAESAATGEVDVQVGNIHFGNEQYDQAIKYLESALKKGGLKDMGTVEMTLGIAQLKKGQRDQARATFKSIPADSQLNKVADAWILRSYN